MIDAVPDSSLWFGLLGPLCVRVDHVEVRVPPRLKTLLGTLLLNANEAISVAELTALESGSGLALVTPATLRTYVRRLRTALGPVAGPRIVTCHGGYLIEVREDELDVQRFDSLFRAGKLPVRNGSWQLAAEVLAEALQLWRGSPLTDVPSAPSQRADTARFEEMRLQALEWRIEADLRLGHHEGLVPESQELAAAYPYRERFHEQLMLALFRGGRQADALATYQAARRVLVDELGVEPGTNLRLLHGRILAGDALGPAGRGPDETETAQAPPGEGTRASGMARTGSEPAAQTATPQPVKLVPRRLPAALRHFADAAGNLST